jgi:hypothetical protein
VGPQLHAHGLRLIANVSGGVNAPVLRTELLRYVDGTMEEGWMRPTTRQSQRLAGGCTWTRQLAEELTSEVHGKLFLAELPADASDTHAITYGLASFLLGADGNASFDVEGNPHYARGVWVRQFDTARRLSVPRGSLTIGSDGLYRRDFTRGVVLVNPTTAAITVRLAGRYSGSGYADVTRLTLEPTSGVILLRQR